MEEPEVPESNQSFINNSNVTRYPDGEISPKQRRRPRRRSYEHTFIMMFVILSIFFVVALYVATRVSNYTWPGMSAKQRAQALNGSVKFAGVNMKCSDLFNASDSEVFDKLSSEQIERLMSGETLDLDEDDKNRHLEKAVHLVWSNLTDGLREKVASAHVLFQGQEIQLHKLIGNETEVYELLESEEIFLLIKNENTLTIGRPLNFTSDFYIERKFYNDANALNVKSFEDLLKDAQVAHDDEDYFEHSEASVTKPILISDEAGTGKSTVLQQIALKLKEKFPEKLVSLIDAGAHKEFFTKIAKNADEYSEGQLVEILAELLKPFGGKFDDEAITKQLKSGNVILFWDGLDDSPYGLKSLLESIDKKTKAQQWLATRPPLGDELEEVLGVRGYKLLSFSEGDREEFLRHIFEADTEAMTFEAMMVTIRDELKIHYRGTQRGFFETPAMLSTLADTAREKELDPLNLYSIYEHLTREIFKGNDSDAPKIHQKYALLEIFDDELTSPDNKQRSSSDLPLQLIGEDFEDSLTQISRLGLLTVNPEKDEISFSHHSFEEFFAAHYLIENICKPQNTTGTLEIESRIRLLLKALHHESRLSAFLVSYFQLPPSKCADNKQFAEALTTSVKKKLKTFILGGDFEKNLERASTFTRFFPDVARKLWHIDENETFLTWLANYRPHEFIRHHERIKNVSQMHFSDVERLFEGNYQEGNFLFTAAQYHKRLTVSIHVSNFSSLEFLNLTGFGENFDHEKFASCKELSQFLDFLRRKFTNDEIVKELFRRSSGRILRFFVKTLADFDAIWGEIKALFTDPYELQEFLLIDGGLLESTLKNSGRDTELILAVIEKYNEELRNGSNLFESLYFQTDEGDNFLRANLDVLIKEDRIFKNFWGLIKTHTTLEQRTQLLLMNLRSNDAVHNVFYAALMKARESVFEAILSAYDETFDKRMMRYLCLNFFGTFEEHIQDFFHIGSATFKRFIEYCKEIFANAQTKEFLKVLENFKVNLDKQKHNKRYKLYAAPLDGLIKSLRSAGA